MADEVEKVLIRHFDEHQNSCGGQGIAVEARVTAIYGEIDEIELQHKVDNVKLSDDDNANASFGDFNEVLSSTLMHFLDCSLATEVSPDTKESIEVVQELLVAVASQRVSIARRVLQNRLVPFTVVLLERVRSTACRCIGWTVEYLLKCQDIAKEDLDELLDAASQALLPRFTDKTQSVRQSAIEASRFFFGTYSAGQIECAMDDPDIRQSLQWSLQHDPSVTNRVAALESLPVTFQTMDVILTRVRDVKQKVRVAAIKALQKSVPDLKKWAAEQCAELVESGWTDRCTSTKAETERMVFLWMKSFNFDILAILRHLDVVLFEESSKKIMFILLNAENDFVSSVLSGEDGDSFNRGIKLASAKPDTINHTLDPEKVFMLQSQRTRAKTLEPRARETFLSEILPDVPEICALFELHASALIQAIADAKESEIIDGFVSICLNLLAMIDSGPIEEGSRLHLKSTLKKMLESVVLPDDLVEGSIDTLCRIHRIEEDFWESALSSAEALHSQGNDDGLTDNRTLRILSILCTVFERSSSRLASNSIMDDFVKYVTPSVAHNNPVVREAAVSCLGKLGLFSSEEKVCLEFKPMLVERLMDEDEKLSIRAQAVLGFTDLAMLFSRFVSSGSNESSVHDLLFNFMNNADVSLVCVAAEATAKLLFAGKFCDESCLAQLLVLFFDPRLTGFEEEPDSDTSKEIGSPVRLQQLLTQFFSLFCLRGEVQRRSLVACTRRALEIAISKGNGKKKGGVKSIPIAKVIEFISATADEARIAFVAKRKETEVAKHSSPGLLVAIQITKFLVCNSEDLTVTTLRNLCKILSTTEVNSDQDDLADVRLLLDGTEDLGNLVTDEACLQHLSVLTDKMDGFQCPNDSTWTDDEDTDSLNMAMAQVQISPGRSSLDKENPVNLRMNTEGKKDSTVRPSRLSMSSVNEP